LIDTGAAWPTSSSFLPLLREALGPLTDGGIEGASPDPITAITDIVLTHRHADHIGGLKAILQVFSSNDTPQPRIHKHRHPILAEGEEGGNVDWDQLLLDDVWPTGKAPADMEWLTEGYRIHLHDSTSPSDETTLRVIHTPGHTPDSISLVLEETKELFTADTVLG
jgi:ribonuclease/clavin/mitogillin